MNQLNTLGFFVLILFAQHSFALADYKSGLHCATKKDVFSLCPQNEKGTWLLNFYDGNSLVKAKECVETNSVVSCDLGDESLYYDRYDFFVGKTYPDMGSAWQVMGVRTATNLGGGIPVLDETFTCNPLDNILKEHCVE